MALPSSPHDVKGLMVGAVRDDNPTVVILNKRMLGTKGPVPEEIYEIPFGQANVLREGKDVTIIAVGRMVPESVVAAGPLAEAGIEAEVIDVRTVQPLDSATILDRCAARTGRSSSTRPSPSAGSARRSPRRSRRRRSTTSTPRCCASVRRSRRCRSARCWRRAYIPDSKRIADGVRHLLERPGA